MKPRVVIVGLGPAGPDLLTAAAVDAIARLDIRLVRTSRHPSASAVPDPVFFDDVYEQEASFDDVYRAICHRVSEQAKRHGEVLYAVPGSPLVLERTVRELRRRADIACDVLPSLSFLDLAYDRLEIDPVEAGIRLVDGHQFAVSAAGERGPLLVAHCHANWVLSDIKLSSDNDPDDEVVVLQRLGCPDELIVRTTWSDLDRTVDADHLTSVYIPQMSAPVGQEYVRFHSLARTLRERCPWDRQQDHRSLVPHLIEETYETVDALESLDPDNPATDDHLIEELGDLLYQVEFHATIAEQEGRFTIADVARAIHDKLVFRHPHVFGDVSANDVDTINSNWEELKQQEKQRTTMFEGIPRHLPALMAASKSVKRVEQAEGDLGGLATARDSAALVAALVNELRARIPPPDAEAVGAFDTPSEAHDHERTTELEHLLGELLFATAAVARHMHIDPEVALRDAVTRFRIAHG